MVVIPVVLTLLLIQASTEHSIKPRISNGLNSSPDQFLFVASIQLIIPPYRTHHHECAGTAIDKYWILSSAVCAVKVRSNMDTAMAYIHMYFTENNNAVNVEMIHIDDAIPHEHFDPSRHQNDVSVIKLATAIINPVTARRPDPRNSIVGQVWMMGWGRTSAAFSDNIPEVLQYAFVRILNNQACQGKVGKLVNLQDSHICTYVIGKAITGCKGDTGGPLIRYVDNEPEVVGILSCTAEPCGQVGMPTVSSRVTYFNTWINEQIRKKPNTMSENDNLYTPLLVS